MSQYVLPSDLVARVRRVVNSMSRSQKHALLLVVNSGLAPIAYAVTLVLMDHEGGAVISRWAVLCALPFVAAVVAGALGLQHLRLKPYAGLGMLRSIAQAMLVAVVSALIGAALGFAQSMATAAVFALIYILSVIVGRYAMLHMLLALLRSGAEKHAVLIYGAGDAGGMLAAAMWAHPALRVVGFVDDDPVRQGNRVAGVMVHPPDRIAQFIGNDHVRRVILAMPSLPRQNLRDKADALIALGLDVQVVPSFAQLLGPEKILDSLTSVPAERFLGRNCLSSLQGEAGCDYHGKTILVSGAGGSVGGELCRQLLGYRPAKLILLDASELALYSIHRELEADSAALGVVLQPCLASICDLAALHRVFAAAPVDVVLHAAAYKHVPMVEANPVAGLAVNVLGTHALAGAAQDAGVKRFILISTDKAVRPSNMMGASKRLAELVVQDMARRGTTDFSIVRFGNVLGSSGSVVPLFREQIAKGGPLTLTHEDVTRYFMTLSEAASLVLVAAGLPRGFSKGGGDLFVLDMGKPVRIRDLAEQMIATAGRRLRSAHDPQGDIEIRVTGLRPGEKLHEELLIKPGYLPTPHEKILRVQEAGLSASQMAGALQQVARAVALADPLLARAVIAAHVDGYDAQPQGFDKTG